jgi:hypothetical protein
MHCVPTFGCSLLMPVYEVVMHKIWFDGIAVRDLGSTDFRSAESELANYRKGAG